MTEQTNKPLQVLIIEDNTADADLVGILLAEADPAGYDCRHVPTLGEGVAALRESAFDVVLLDLGLPDSQGLPTLERLLAAGTGLPVVIMSGDTDEETALQAVRGAAQDYLVKGDFGPRTLTRTLRYAIERKRLTDRLEAALEDNRMLIREVYHRTRNNLSLVASLLNLQADQVHDPRDAELFKDVRGRVITLSSIHEQLSRSSSLREVDASEYLNSVAVHLIRSAPHQGIDLVVSGGTAPLTCETAIPLGLIVNELVTNSVKHAFVDRERGLITIELTREEGVLFVEYRDNGVGLPEGFESRRAETLGMSLVTSLTYQIDGSLTVLPGPGAGFVFRIPLPEPHVSRASHPT